MKPPFDLVFHGMPRSDALEAAAARHASRLDRFRRDISHCKVNVVLDERRDHQGKPFNIRIEVTIPGRQLVSSKECNEDVYVALRKAFGNVTRMLDDTARKQRGGGKRHDARPAGPATPSRGRE